MNIPFKYGFDLVAEILKQISKDEYNKKCHDIYWFSNLNGINHKYKTFEDFMKSMTPIINKNMNEKNSATEILKDVKTMMDNFF